MADIDELVAAQQAAADVIHDIKDKYRDPLAMDIIREVAVGYLVWLVRQGGWKAYCELINLRLMRKLCEAERVA